MYCACPGYTHEPDREDTVKKKRQQKSCGFCGWPLTTAGRCSASLFAERLRDAVTYVLDRARPVEVKEKKDTSSDARSPPLTTQRR